MGVGVSSWVLANAVSRTGLAMGVVSGTALDNVLIRRLQLGDVGGHVQRALEHFPRTEVSERILSSYFIPGGKEAGVPFVRASRPLVIQSQEYQELLVAANFVEVYLAREGHSGPVGINYLEKIQMPLLASIYGALLAGVDYVVMGAGMPTGIPAALDKLSRHEDAAYKVDVQGVSKEDHFAVHFSPRQIMGSGSSDLKRPLFLGIVATTLMARYLAKKAKPPIDGLVVSTGGGHKAPPSKKGKFNERGEPVYGPEDVPDPAKIAELGLPFWLAGGYGSPEKRREALALGAAGVQVGTAFALCEESGFDPAIKSRILKEVAEGGVDVFTDPVASPTGYPFNVGRLEGTLSHADLYEARPRACDLGYLRVIYKKEDGSLGYRCSAEPVNAFVGKGGNLAETVGRICLCNALMAAAGFPQVRVGGAELAMVTLGDDINSVRRFFPPDGSMSFTAADVIRILLSEENASDL